MTKVVAGIDIGGTNTAIGLVDFEGEIIAETSISTDTHEDFNLYMSDLCTAIKKSMKSISNDYKLCGIGVGAPNANYHTGTIEEAPNLRWKGTVKFVDLMKKQFEMPIVLTNDANAAAMGELIFGAGKWMKDFVVITLGTGLGSGIIVNGELVYGHDGFAGEVGHTTYDRNGRICGCGRKGCLETYVSATGIKRTVFELLCNSTKTSVLRDVTFNEMTSERIYKEAVCGDVIALEAFNITGEILGTKLAETVAHTSPEAIFLFGGLAKAGNYILKPTKKALEENLLPIFKNKVKVLISGLQDKNAAILGSAALAWKETNKLIKNV